MQTISSYFIGARPKNKRRPNEDLCIFCISMYQCIFWFFKPSVWVCSREWQIARFFQQGDCFSDSTFSMKLQLPVFFDRFRTNDDIHEDSFHEPFNSSRRGKLTVIPLSSVSFLSLKIVTCKAFALFNRVSQKMHRV